MGCLLEKVWPKVLQLLERIHTGAKGRRILGCNPPSVSLCAVQEGAGSEGVKLGMRSEGVVSILTTLFCFLQPGYIDFCKYIRLFSLSLLQHPEGRL